MTTYGYEGNETLATKTFATETLDPVEVDIVGCFYKDTEEGKFDFYDLYVDGQCINLGEPCYEYPTNEDITAFLELQAELNKEE